MKLSQLYGRFVPIGKLNHKQTKKNLVVVKMSLFRKRSLMSKNYPNCLNVLHPSHKLLSFKTNTVLWCARTYLVEPQRWSMKVYCTINWSQNWSRSMRWSVLRPREQVEWREAHSGTKYKGSLRGNTQHASSRWWPPLVCLQFLLDVVSTN